MFDSFFYNNTGECFKIDALSSCQINLLSEVRHGYVQCKYGSKALPLSKDGNAVFVKQLADVKPVLEAFRTAASAGELDGAIAALMKR